ncbi:MAG: hypothetical protein ACRDRO_27470 [Pseudonocardiaceae bacterium]
MFTSECGSVATGEKFAVMLYSDATRVDPYPGSYPPSDTGSSGLAICKILASRGTIRGYQGARSADGFLTLLQAGPVRLRTCEQLNSVDLKQFAL